MTKNKDKIEHSRRNFLTIGVGIAATSVISSVLSSVNAEIIPTKVDASQCSGNSNADLQSTKNWNDNLAHQIPYNPAPGTGKKLGLALGGGGLYLISFYCGYFHGLKKYGIDLSLADIVVGTSAGSVAGSMLTSGNLWRITSEINLFAYFPKLFAKAIPTKRQTPSQIRATNTLLTTTSATTSAIQAIGKAAMAANNTANFESYPKAIHRLIGLKKWPSPAMHITANDCYTGERIVISADDNININNACAASSSIPGKMGPTWIGERLCMDGGICQTSTHCDVISGVKKAIVISLGDGTSNEITQGLRTSSLPDTLNQEIADLKKSGTEVFHVVVGLAPGVKHVDNIMDPKWAAPLLKYGYERAMQDAEKLSQFWLA